MLSIACLIFAGLARYLDANTPVPAKSLWCFLAVLFSSFLGFKYTGGVTVELGCALWISLITAWNVTLETQIGLIKRNKYCDLYGELAHKQESFNLAEQSLQRYLWLSIVQFGGVSLLPLLWLSGRFLLVYSDPFITIYNKQDQVGSQQVKM